LTDSYKVKSTGAQGHSLSVGELIVTTTYMYVAM
jgi:hypothetical protein